MTTYNQALENGIIKYGVQRAKERQIVAFRMKTARKTFPADMIFDTRRIPLWIKAERQSMRAYAKTLR